jgi:transcriptional regulator with XRE-family HTH domain
VPSKELEGCGDAVRIARAIRGWTQRELGEVSGLPMWMIWQIEHNLRQPKSEEWSRIWSALSTE